LLDVFIFSKTAVSIYGGFNWMTAAGNAEKVEKGKQILVWATIGLIVIFTPVKYRAVANLR